MINLVTGASGLVGSHMVFELLHRGEQVIALTRNISSKEKVEGLFNWYFPEKLELLNNIQWLEGDMLDLSCLHNALPDVDRVYHCAGYVSFNKADTQRLHDINVNGTSNVVNSCLLFDKPLCFVSSVAATEPDPEHDSISELNTWKSKKGKSVYATSKYLAELEVWRGITEGLSAAIVNPSVIIGPGDYTRSSGRLFDQIYHGMKYYTDGITGYVDVRDVATIMVDVMEKEIWGERFILNAENLSYKALFTFIARNLHVQEPEKQASYRLAILASRLDKIKSLITGTSHRLTKATVKAGFSKQYYNNQKVTELLNVKFRNTEESIKLVSKHFLETVV